MISFLKNKKVRNWCLFDFGISSFPTLVLTFFYGAFYARHIVGDITEGTSLWGFSLSLGSLLAASILGINNISIKKKLIQWRSNQSKAVKKKPN